MRKKNFSVLICGCLWFLGGCGIFPTSNATKTPIPTKYPPATELADGSDQNTRAPQELETRIIPSAPSATPTLCASNTPDASPHLSESCVTYTDTLNDELEGAIVLENSSFHVQLLNLSSLEVIDFGRIRHFVGGVGISQDHQSFAYIDIDEKRLKVVNSEGAIDKSIEVSENWQNVIQWTGHDSLLIENMPLHPDGSIDPPAFSVHFDISKNEILADYNQRFPGQLYLGNNKPDWGPYLFTQAVFNSDFDTVLYPTFDENGSFTLVLCDLKNNREITRFYGRDPDNGGLPTWFRNGDTFIAGVSPRIEDYDGNILWNYRDGMKYEAGYDLFLINKNGAMERLTYLSTTYRSLQEGYALSPDEKKLAFWLTLSFDGPDWSDERQLAILDLETKEIERLCIQGNDYHYPPVWSSGGDRLAITISDWEWGTEEVFAVDLENRTYTKIAEDSIAIGWVSSSE